MFSIIGLMLINAAAVAAPPQQDGSSTVIVETKIVKGGDAKGHEERVVVGDASASCGEGRRFEAVGNDSTDGKENKIRMVICGEKGETDAAWAKKLTDARGDVAKMEAPASLKARILAEFDAEIARTGR